MKKTMLQLIGLVLVCVLCVYVLHYKFGVSILGEGGLLASVLAMFFGAKIASKRVELNKKLVQDTEKDKEVLAEQQRRYEQQSEEVKEAIQTAQEATRQIEQITVVVSGHAQALEAERKKLSQQIQEQTISAAEAEEYLRRNINEN